MPPDLNGLPPSPRQPGRQSPAPPSVPASRRTSQYRDPSRRSSQTNHGAMHDGPGVPVRHPKPMTPAELHLALEKEQESIVNRLTRELAQLRAQTASVASNASSNSSSAIHDPMDASSAPPSTTQPFFPSTGPTHPTPSRQRRSSSSVSARSHASQMAPPPGPAHISTSQASVDRARDAAGSVISPLQRSRQNSTVVPAPAAHAPHRPASTAPSPSPSPSLRNSHVFSGENAAYFPQPTHPAARAPSISLSSSMSSLHGLHSPQVAARDASVAALREAREEAAVTRQALEASRSENEALLRRVKELEREVRRMRRPGEAGGASST